MEKDLNGLQNRLRELMSSISERCYSAGWAEDLEYALWTAVLSGPRNYGQSMISAEDILQLQDLSEKCNSWIVWDDENEETAVDLDFWKTRYLSEMGRFRT